MFKQLTAVFLIAGATGTTGLATEISENFTGVTNQILGDGPGIFNIPASNAPVSGTLTFNPEDFSPNPVAPSGQQYLAFYSGGAGSVSMRLTDAGGTEDIAATASSLLLCAQCLNPWKLVVSSKEFGFTVLLNSTFPVTFTPGSSIFEVSGPLEAGAKLSVLLSDPTAGRSLGFGITDFATTPEPSTTGFSLLSCGVAGLLFFGSRRSIAAKRR